MFKTEIRIHIVGLIFLIAISVILAQLWRVQVLNGKFYSDKIHGSGKVTVRIPSVRGEIRDRRGLRLVTNRPSFSVEFYLKEMVTGYQQAFGKKNTPTLVHKFTVKGVYKEDTQPDVGRIVREIILPRMGELGIHEDIDDDELQKHFYNDTLVPYTYLDDIDFGQMAKLSERDLGLPGARVTIGGVRQYPYGALAAHILGYVGSADTDPEDAKNFDYYQPDVEGKTNVEQAMDHWLRGEPGVRYIKRSPKGVIEGELGVTPPVPGHDVYLTIDARIQTIAENAMRVVGRGAAVVVDPKTGDVLAMASVPSFDPNTFIPSITTEDWKKLIDDDTNPLTNRAILSYAPGSTFKTITALAGLVAGKGGNQYTCTGGVTYGNRYMHCWIGQKGGAHGTLDLEGGIKNSCNSYFFQLGNAAGVDTIDRIAAALGIGQRTGVPLSNEAAGVLPGKEWLAVHYPKDRWSDGHTANMSIGQGYVQCSPLQMAMVAATFANGGTCYYPRMIDRIVDQKGQDVVDPDTGKLAAPGPRVRVQLSDLGLKPEQVEKVRHGMWRVVNDAGGTAPHARLKQYEIAGKTGTAQFWRNGIKDNHTWFISFAPYKQPKYAVCVFIQGAQGGGVTAGPLAAKIIDEAMALDDDRHYEVAVKPLEPAVGNFTFIKNIDFTSAVPVQTEGGDKKHAVADGETPSEENEPAANDDEKKRDHDRVASAQPKMRAKTADNANANTPSANGNENGNNPFIKSVRKFFRRDSDQETSQDLSAQQKNLQREKRRQQQPSNQPQPQQQTQDQPPKRKKFLGIF